MLPKWHLIIGIIFAAFLFFLLGASLLNCSIFILASVFIDIDHYLFYASKNKNWNLRRAYVWHKALPYNHKPMTQIFHTLEFMLLIGILSFFHLFFLFVIMGLLVHSITDLIDMSARGWTIERSGREFSLIKYILTKDKSVYF